MFNNAAPVTGALLTSLAHEAQDGPVDSAGHSHAPHVRVARCNTQRHPLRVFAGAHIHSLSCAKTHCLRRVGGGEEHYHGLERFRGAL